MQPVGPWPPEHDLHRGVENVIGSRPVYSGQKHGMVARAASVGDFQGSFDNPPSRLRSPLSCLPREVTHWGMLWLLVLQMCHNVPLVHPCMAPWLWWSAIKPHTRAHTRTKTCGAFRPTRRVETPASTTLPQPQTVAPFPPPCNTDCATLHHSAVSSTPSPPPHHHL